MDTSASVSGVSLTACKPSKLRVRTYVGTPAVSAVGADYAITPYDAAWKPASAAITATTRGAESTTTSSAWQYAITHQTVSGAKGYRVYVSTTANAVGTAGAVHTGAQTTVDLTKGTMYTLHVETQNDCGTTMGPAYTLTSEAPAKANCTTLANGKLRCIPLQLPSTIERRPLGQ